MVIADVTITMPRTEALALVSVAETGRTVADVLGLVQNLSTSERAIDNVQAALRAKAATVTMTRTEALALVNVAEIGRKVGEGLKLIDNMDVTRRAIGKVQAAAL